MTTLEGLPIRTDWQQLRERFMNTVTRDFPTYLSPQAPNYAAQLAFACGRFDDGMALLSHLARQRSFDRPANVLDVGSGNGGISFAFANVRSARVHTLDLVPNVHLAALRSVLPVPIVSTVADGSELPFQDASFDVVLLLDTIEHVNRPRRLGSEVMRILRPNGVCVVTTPARSRYLFRRDPHYGVLGLVALPNSLQRFVVNRVLGRRILAPTGTEAFAYDVTRLYWNVGQVTRLFPGAKEIEVLFNRTYTPPGRFTIEWIRHPRYAVEQLRYNVRRWFFDGILLWK
jgi:SAM-dependent methyltransferase